MIKFYKQVELPEFCFLSEAVEFLTLGRVPEIDWSNEPIEVGTSFGSRSEGIDYRFDWRELPDNSEPSHYGFEILEEEDFYFLNIPYPKGYVEAAESFLFGDIAEAKRRVEMCNNDTFSRYEKQVQEKLIESAVFAKSFLKEQDEAIRLYEKTHKDLEVFFERSWAILFDKIQSEQIIVSGIDETVWDELAEKGEYEKAAETLIIPKEAVRLRHDYRQNQLSYKNQNFIAARVSTKSIMDIFLTFASSKKLNEVEQWGQFISLRDDSGIQSQQLRRGTRSKIDWQVLREFLAANNQKGLIPEKKEACIAEVIEFAQNKLKRKVGRSTVQRQLKSELDKLYAQ